MSKTDVQTLVNLISNGQYDTTLFDGFYQDVMNDLGLANWHTTTATISVAAGSDSIALPSTLLNLLMLIYDGDVMSDLSLRELESLDYGWRNAKGRPIAYTRQSETAKSVEIYPTPTLTLNATSIHSEYRTDCLPYLDIPIALKILQREYARESDHNDLELAGYAGAMADTLLELMK